MLSIKRITNGKVLTNQNDILNEVSYGNLYAEKSEQDTCGPNSTDFPTGTQKISKQEQMLRKPSKTVSRKNRQFCEKEITTQEIQKAIPTFQNNKSPRNDGLTPEFYKTFTHLLITDLTRIIQ